MGISRGAVMTVEVIDPHYVPLLIFLNIFGFRNSFGHFQGWCHDHGGNLAVIMFHDAKERLRRTRLISFSAFGNSCYV